RARRQRRCAERLRQFRSIRRGGRKDERLTAAPIERAAAKVALSGRSITGRFRPARSSSAARQTRLGPWAAFGRRSWQLRREASAMAGHLCTLPPRPSGAINGVVMRRPIRILGIDPGLRRTGWGLIDVEGNRLIYVACGSVAT